MDATERLSLASAKYHCTSCGDCCRGWQVTLVGQEHERVREYLTPLVPAKRLAAALALGPQTMRLGPQGCVSLTDDQLCRIHAAHGAEAKPATCRIFPFSFTQTPTGVRVGISYACPGVLDGAGRALEEQRDEIASLYSSAVRGSPFLHAVPERIALDETLSLDWVSAERLIDGLAETLASDGPLVERMARARATIDGLRKGLGAGQPFAAAHPLALRNAPAAAAALLRERRPPDFFSNALLRAIVVSGSLSDSSGFARLASVAVGLLGSRGVGLRDGRTVPFSAIEAVPAGLGEEGERLVLRWLVATVQGLGFFGERVFALTLSAGFELLTIATAAVGLVARTRAAAAGKAAATLDDVQQAVYQIESSLYHRSQVPDRLYRLLDDTNGLDVLFENC